MTPPQAQEAGIDFEEARRIANIYLSVDPAKMKVFDMPKQELARAYLALLATHEGEKARYREALEQAPAPFDGRQPYADEYHAWWKDQRSAALTPESPPVEAEGEA